LSKLLLLDEQFWQVAMTQNSLYLSRVLVLLFQLVRICKLLFLSRQQGLESISGIGFPNSNVGVFTARRDILRIVRVQDCVNLLHSFRVVNFTRTTVIVGEDPDSFIIRRSSELLSSWRKIDVQDSLQVVLVNHLWLVKLSHVKRVAVGVFIANNDVHGFLGVPAESRRLVLHVDFLQRTFASQVVEAQRSVHAYRGNEIGL